MRIGVPKESIEGERRVALIPDTVKALTGKELDVVVESGAGDGAGHPDEQYTDAGAEIGDAWSADIVLHVATPSTDEIGRLGSGKVLIGFLAPLTATDTTKALASGGVTSFAVEAIPRITRAQAMDALSSQANVAGYASALLAAREAGRFFPMMTTAPRTSTRACRRSPRPSASARSSPASTSAAPPGSRSPRSAGGRSSSTSSPTPRTRAATPVPSPTRRTSRSARPWPRTPAGRT